MSTHYDICIVGGGSGGVGAAIAASRRGLKTLVVEANDILGGTSTVAGVNTWEMGVGGTGIPFDIYKRMKTIPGSTGVYTCERHFGWQEKFYWPNELDKVNFPGGYDAIDPNRFYVDSLRRFPGEGVVRDQAFWQETWHGVTFEPSAYHQTVMQMLDETGSCDVLLSTRLVDVTRDGGRVVFIQLDNDDEIAADYWVDGSGFLAFKAGCNYFTGQDPKSRFNEATAPDEPTDRVNAMTQIYRVKRVDAPEIEPLPEGIPAECWWANSFPPVSCNEYPCGDRNMNMLPTMQGSEYMAMDKDEAKVECERRVYAQWHFIQTHFEEFQYFRLDWIAPMFGVRETHRFECEYMLREDDLDKGLRGQAHDDMITMADHARDVHGEGGACPELDWPYGVPFRCLIPKGMDNLLIAGRVAGFSSIAASSCRLSRTMMQLGQAAGTAISLIHESGARVRDVDAGMLRGELRNDHVSLEWPMSDELLEYLRDE